MKFTAAKSWSTPKKVFTGIALIVGTVLVYFLTQFTYWQFTVSQMTEPYKSTAENYCYLSFDSCGVPNGPVKFPSFSCLKEVDTLMKVDAPLPPNCPSDQVASYPLCQGGLPHCGTPWK